MAGPGDPKRGAKPRPPRLVEWWERLETWKQLAISFPVFSVFMFLINIGPFSQPTLRSIFYGFFEGGVLSGFMAVVTANERTKRS
jgi:hypothetical protein